MERTKLWDLTTSSQKNARNFKQSGVSKVHQIIIDSPSHGNFDVLLYNKYQQVLWYHLDRDLSLSHVELLLLLCLYAVDLEIPILLDEKLDVLIARLLHVTFTIRSDTNFRFHRVAMLLLQEVVVKMDLRRCLVDGEYNSSLGPENLLKNWLKTVISKTINLLHDYSDDKSSIANDSEFPGYVRETIQFFKLLDVKELFECINRDIPGIKPELKNLIDTGDKYPIFLRKHYKKYDLPPTLYDVSDLAFLDDLEIEAIEDILKELDLSLSGDRRAKVSGLKAHLIKLWFDTDDIEIYYDIFDNQSMKFLCKSYPFHVFNHVQLVLKRVKIGVNKQQNLRVAGNSKYFHPIKMSNGYVDVKCKERVVLVEISKPNKYATRSRVKLFGLERLKLATVLKGGNSSLLDCDDDRFNYMIEIPEHHEYSVEGDFHHEKLQLDELIVDGYVQGSEFPETKKITGPSTVKIDYVNSQVEVLGKGLFDLSNSEALDILKALENRVHIIDIESKRGFGLLDCLLTNLSSMGRTMVIFPGKSYVNQYRPPESLCQTLASITPNDFISDPLETIKQILQATRVKALDRNEDGDFYGSTVTNALSYYEKFGTEDNVYETLKHISVVLKVENCPDKVREILVNSIQQTVFVTQDEAKLVKGQFKNVVVYGGEDIDVFHNSFERLTIFKTGILTKRSILNRAGYNYKECINKALRSIKYVPIPGSSNNVNVLEAETAIKLSNYSKAQLVVGSWYQKALIQEMGQEALHISELVYHENVVLSLHHYESVNDILRCEARLDKLTLVGQLLDNVPVNRTNV